VNDILFYTIGLHLPSGSAQVSLPPAIIALPALPVMNSEAFSTNGGQKTLAVSILAVALELEGKALQAAIAPRAVALPAVSHGGRGRGSHESRNGCEGEVHVEEEVKDVCKVVG
jgi:hypothetical protein